MGLFNNFVGDALNTITLGGARKFIDDDIGTTDNFLEGVVNAGTLGIGGKILNPKDDGKKAAQFDPDTGRLESDIDRVRQLGINDPTELRQSANIQLDQLSEDKKQLLGELAKQNQGQLTGSFDRLATKGGLSGGASERLARQSNRDSLFGQQKTGAAFGKFASDVRSGDFRDQEALKNRALFATPGLERGVTDINIGADAANQRARALFDANKSAKKNQLLNSLFSVGGAVAGGLGTGTLKGASLGAGVGGTAAGLFT